ncbi:MAG TPA: hypothetical protein VK427_25465 [Kofleriaceae bacterium]|nr:hypothetical protein [Kofleriaceae bacterium]
MAQPLLVSAPPTSEDTMPDGLITIAGGILAASALVIARKPNARTPYFI